VSEDQTTTGISQAPVNILFDTASIKNKDVWDINIIQILELLLKILNQTGKKDLRVAGMAALSSSLIHRMKVESIFALQKAAMEKKAVNSTRRLEYRHDRHALSSRVNISSNSRGAFEFT